MHLVLSKSTNRAQTHRPLFPFTNSRN